MATTSAAAPANCLVLSWQSIHHLRSVLERDAGMQAATWLQEAGFAGGEALAAAYADWLGERYGVRRPASLDVRHLGETLSSFFHEYGWGTVRVTPLTTAVISLESTDWWEANPAVGSTYPCCHLSSGLLAEFLSRASETTLGVMEVECRTQGDPCCRFLAGAPETMQTLYERLSQGQRYQDALGLPG